MSTVFFTADLHFGHESILRYVPEHRPFDTIEAHDEAIVDRWNSTVGARDTVYVLGDVVWNHGAADTLRLLNGTLRLVLGNHDNAHVDVLSGWFRSVSGCKEYRRGILTHIPVHPGQFERYAFNIHGHLHAESINDPRYICVSLEQWGLRPVSIDELRATGRLPTRRAAA